MTGTVKPWLTVIGIGADGLSGLSAKTRNLLGRAELLVGGERHQAMVGDGQLASGAQRWTWHRGVAETATALQAWKGRAVCVLVSGDPMNFGAGAVLAQHFGADEMMVVAHTSAFSLACARMVWPVPEVAAVTVHGRALEVLNIHVTPGARIVVLSWDGSTPAAIARLLRERGFGPSRMTVWSHMGADEERRFDGTAADWTHDHVPDLNTVCIVCEPVPGAACWPRTPGLPEEAYIHDGQITKREVRAATLAALGPMPDEMLWDIGSGSGAVAIEWLRASDSAQAMAVERDAARVNHIRANAKALGVPRLQVIEGHAPAILGSLAGRPDAVFVGGGLLEDHMFETVFEALRPGGRIVANAVTLEGQTALLSWVRNRKHGTVSRLSVARADSVGARTALRPMMDVLQVYAKKP